MEGEYYYFDPETRVLKTSGTEKRDGVTYEFSSDGRSTKVEGLKLAGEDGIESWKHEEHGWYYLRDGQKVTNEWLYDGDMRYYVGEDGKMYSGAHFIDGYFYLFDGLGKVMVWGHTYHRGTKYVLGEGGRGIPTEMTPGEQMHNSATAEWCKDTYHIYFVAEDLYRVERSKHSDILAERMKQQWGVSSGEECLTTIRQLFESAKASDDKAEKAWDFSRAMSLSWVGPMIGWWDYETSVNMRVEMAPTIQQSFTSWDDFNDSYMEGFTRWSGGSGETYEKRVRAYNSL